MAKRIVSLFLLVLLGQVLYAQSVKKIAVLETVDQDDKIPNGVELAVRSWMTIAITEFEGYKAYDRINASSMLNEHQFQRTGYVSPESIKKLGQMVGVDYLLISEVGYVDNANIIIVTRLIDITTTEVVQIGNYQTATDANSISSACRALAGFLFNGQSYNNSVIPGKQALVPQSQSSSFTNTTREIDVNGVKFKMIYVAGGTFTMGATAEQDGYEDNETPVHQVTLSDYFIGETEVTHKLWVAVMDSDPYEGVEGYNVAVAKRFSNCPVTNISWEECREFIQKLNQLTGLRFRLPTEAEWEYAARGGNKSKGYKYSGSNRIDDVAWYDGNSGGVMHEVATCYPNELGLYDMSGNVWEWCSDWYGSYSSMAQTDPSGAGSGSSRVCRGGSWGSNAQSCRVSDRDGSNPGYHYFNLGFRLVCSRL